MAEKKVSNADNGEKMVRILLPLSKEERDDVFVRVNHRTWLIKRGEYVEVPECVAEVVQHSEEAKAEAIAYQMANEK